MSKISCNFTWKGRTSRSPRCSETHIFFLKNAGPPMHNLGAFRGITEFTFKVYLRIRLESVIGVSNSCDLAWIWHVM